MVKLNTCCFCERVSADSSTFEKLGPSIFCLNSCEKYVSRKESTGKANLKRKKKAKQQKKHLKKVIDKCGESDKKTEEFKQKRKENNDEVFTEILYERAEKGLKEFETERDSYNPVDDIEGLNVTSPKQVYSYENLDILGTSDLPSVERDRYPTYTDAEKSSKLKVDQALEANNASDKENRCGNCSSPGCRSKCSLCKDTFYCSRQCQRKDWPVHKEICVERLTEEEKEIVKIHEEKTRQRKDYHRKCREFTEETDGLNNILIDDIGDNSASAKIYQTLSLKQALLIANRPDGSMMQAFRMTTDLFPFQDIIIDFDDVRLQPLFPFFPFLFQFRQGYVLLAFIYRFHEDVMKHGVYIKDAVDKRSTVKFYLDHIRDNPSPYFNYSQVKPGAYICILDPKFYLFEDGTFGIRVDDPRRVKVLEL